MRRRRRRRRRERGRETHTLRVRDEEGERRRQTDRMSERESHRERERQKERERERERLTRREREKVRDREKKGEALVELFNHTATSFLSSLIIFLLSKVLIFFIFVPQARMLLSPLDMFRTQLDLYSLFDEEGIPTHDTAGECFVIFDIPDIMLYDIILYDITLYNII